MDELVLKLLEIWNEGTMDDQSLIWEDWPELADAINKLRERS